MFGFYKKKADDPNAAQQNGMVQSRIETVLEDLVEFTERVNTNPHGEGGAKPLEMM